MNTKISNNLTKLVNKSKGDYFSLASFLIIPQEISGDDIKIMDEHKGCMELKKMWEYKFDLIIIETEKLLNCSELSDNALLWVIVHMREKFSKIQEQLTFIEQMIHDTDPVCMFHR